MQKLSYKYQKLGITAIPHPFYSETEIYSTAKKEDPFWELLLAWLGSYKINNAINFSLGYSQMFGTRSLELLKEGSSKEQQNLAWVMISFHPTLFSTQMPMGIAK